MASKAEPTPLKTKLTLKTHDRRKENAFGTEEDVIAERLSSSYIFHMPKELLPPEKDFARAKSFLMKASTITGISMYNHLIDILRKILREKPHNAVDIFESISQKIKLEHLQTKEEFVELPNELSKTAKIYTDLFKKLNSETRNENEQQEFLVSKKTVIKNLDNTNVINSFKPYMALLQEYGIGISQEEYFHIYVSTVTLSQTKPIENVRFWGKIHGIVCDYIIIEATIKPDADFKDMDPLLEKGVEDQEPDLNYPVDYIGPRDKIDNVNIYSDLKLKPHIKGSMYVPSEDIGRGANKHVYFVCNNLGEPWILLPNVSASQLSTARIIKKPFTGIYDSPVISYPPFPGKEINLLRAQIARISASTLISPDGYYSIDEEIMDETGVSYLCIQEKKFSVPVESLLSLTSWVHHRYYILSQGRCIWIKPKRRGLDSKEEETDKQSETEIEAAEEEETEVMRAVSIKEEEVIEFKEEEEIDGPPLLTSISQDVVENEIQPWTVMSNFSLVNQNSAAVLRSNIWPGAYAICDGTTLENVYIGFGIKHSGVLFSPYLPPFPQNQYPSDQIKERKDPSPGKEQILTACKLKEGRQEQLTSEEEQQDEEIETVKESISNLNLEKELTVPEIISSEVKGKIETKSPGNESDNKQDHKLTSQLLTPKESNAISSESLNSTSGSSETETLEPFPKAEAMKSVLISSKVKKSELEMKSSAKLPRGSGKRSESKLILDSKELIETVESMKPPSQFRTPEQLLPKKVITPNKSHILTKPRTPEASQISLTERIEAAKNTVKTMTPNESQILSVEPAEAVKNAVKRMTSNESQILSLEPTEVMNSSVKTITPDKSQSSLSGNSEAMEDFVKTMTPDESQSSLSGNAEAMEDFVKTMTPDESQILSLEPTEVMNSSSSVKTITPDESQSSLSVNAEAMEDFVRTMTPNESQILSLEPTEVMNSSVKTITPDESQSSLSGNAEAIKTMTPDASQISSSGTTESMKSSVKAVTPDESQIPLTETTTPHILQPRSSKTATSKESQFPSSKAATLEMSQTFSTKQSRSQPSPYSEMNLSLSFNVSNEFFSSVLGQQVTGTSKSSLKVKSLGSSDPPKTFCRQFIKSNIGSKESLKIRRDPSNKLKQGIKVVSVEHQQLKSTSKKSQQQSEKLSQLSPDDDDNTKRGENKTYHKIEEKKLQTFRTTKEDKRN